MSGRLRSSPCFLLGDTRRGGEPRPPLCPLSRGNGAGWSPGLHLLPLGQSRPGPSPATHSRPALKKIDILWWKSFGFAPEGPRVLRSLGACFAVWVLSAPTRLSPVASNAEASARAEVDSAQLGSHRNRSVRLAGGAGRLRAGSCLPAGGPCGQPTAGGGSPRPSRSMGHARDLPDDLADGTFPDLWFLSRLPLRGCWSTIACPPLSSFAPYGIG